MRVPSPSFTSSLWSYSRAKSLIPSSSSEKEDVRTIQDFSRRNRPAKKRFLKNMRVFLSVTPFSKKRTKFFVLQTSEAEERLNVHLQLIRDWERPILFYIVLARLTSVAKDSCTMCISYTLTTSQREVGKSTSRAKVISPNSLFFKVVKGALKWSAWLKC